MVLARASKSQDEVVKAILPIVDPAKAEKDANDRDAKESRGFLSPEMAASPVVSGCIYCAVSAAMVLLNKYALSGFEFTSPNTLLLFQCASAVIFVKAAEAMGVWRVEKLRWDVVRVRSEYPLLPETSLSIYAQPCPDHCILYDHSAAKLQYLLCHRTYSVMFLVSSFTLCLWRCALNGQMRLWHASATM